MNEQTAKALAAALELLRRAVSDNTTSNLNRLNKIEEMASGIPGWATAAAAAGAGAAAASSATPRDMRPNPDLDAAMGFGPPASRPAAHQKPVRVETMKVTVAKMLAMGSQVVVAGQSIPLAQGGGVLALPPAQPRGVARRPGAPLSTDAATPTVRVLGFTANQPGASDGSGSGPPRRPRESSRLAGDPLGGGGIAGILTGLFGRVIAPLVALHAILSQTTSGFGVFQKALNVFASAIAPILLPVFAVLAAAVVAASDVIWANLLPHLREWYGFILSTAIPTTKTLVQRLVELASTIAWVIEVARDPSKLIRGTDAERAAGNGPTVGGVADRVGTAVDPSGIGRIVNRIGFGWLNMLPGNGGGVSPGAARTAANVTDPTGIGGWLNPLPGLAGRGVGWLGRVAGLGGGGESPATPAAPAAATTPDRPEKQASGGSAPQPSGGGVFDRALNDVTRSLQMSIGPKASYTGLTEVGKQAQLAALNQDPLDARVLKRSIESIQEFLAAIRDNTGRAADKPVFPTGGR